MTSLSSPPSTLREYDISARSTDVFGRVMQRLEPRRGRVPMWWLCLVGAIGGELFYFFGLFEF